MSLESLGSGSQKRIEEEYAKADPTTFSPINVGDRLSATGEIVDYKYGVYTDGTDEYVLLKNRGPQQQIVSRLLKGVMNVADVIEKKHEYSTDYLSKVMPHDRIAEPTSINEIRADMEILNLLFGDADHTYRPATDYGGESKHNVKVEGGRATQFDFDSASFAVGSMHTRQRYENDGALSLAAKKLAALKARYLGEEGKVHFLAIIEASGQHPVQLFPYSGASSTPEEFYAAFIERIDRALAFVQNEAAALQKDAA